MHRPSAWLTAIANMENYINTVLKMDMVEKWSNLDVLE